MSVLAPIQARRSELIVRHSAGGSCFLSSASVTVRVSASRQTPTISAVFILFAYAILTADDRGELLLQVKLRATNRRSTFIPECRRALADYLAIPIILQVNEKFFELKRDI